VAGGGWAAQGAAERGGCTSAAATAAAAGWAVGPASRHSDWRCAGVSHQAGARLRYPPELPRSRLTRRCAGVHDDITLQQSYIHIPPVILQLESGLAV